MRAVIDICAIRSIPAWAGETPIPSRACVATGVYPRVGGGNAVPSSVSAN